MCVHCDYPERLPPKLELAALTGVRRWPDYAGARNRARMTDEQVRRWFGVQPPVIDDWQTHGAPVPVHLALKFHEYQLLRDGGRPCPAHTHTHRAYECRLWPDIEYHMRDLGVTEADLCHWFGLRREVVASWYITGAPIPVHMSLRLLRALNR